MHRSEYETFVSSSVWKEIVETLEEVKKAIVEKDFAVIKPTGEGVVDLARQQGRYNMIEFVLALPEDILRVYEEAQRREKEAYDGRTE